jgi:hypothetical protein
MNGIDDYLAAGVFALDGATGFMRLRAGETASDYNPNQASRDWDHPILLPVSGALSSSSSRRTPDGLREQTTSTATLTIDDPDADIKLGDRIRPDPDDGRCWEVTGFPSRDVNAFTGWQPTLEIQLTEHKG